MKPDSLKTQLETDTETEKDMKHKQTNHHKMLKRC